MLELLHLAGRSLPHSVLMMIPEAWENHAEMDPARRAFYEYHSTLMEPWDGPACLTFTDGTLIGAVLDRNGLRPGRYWVTEDGLVVLASEAGVLDIDPATVVRKGRLEPGRMFLVDTGAGRIVEDDEIKAQLAAQRPYAQWVAGEQGRPDRPARARARRALLGLGPPAPARVRLHRGGAQGPARRRWPPPAPSRSARWAPTRPVAVLSQRPRLLFDYFTQMFAQVTNPPLDAIREELVTSIGGAIGPEPNLLDDAPEHARKLFLPFPVIDNDELAKIARVHRDPRLAGIFKAITVRGLYRVAGGGAALEERLEEIFAVRSTARSPTA